jgi:uncharacterized membrane protein
MDSDRLPPVRSRLGRFAVYGAIGLVFELVFTGLKGAARGESPVRAAHTSLWMFPVYGLMQPLFEPVHDRLRGRARLPARAATYTAGFFAVEYVSGWLFRRLRGHAPWDYHYARWNIHGLIRLDYAPLWAAMGLAMERVHDLLADVSPSAGRRLADR